MNVQALRIELASNESPSSLQAMIRGFEAQPPSERRDTAISLVRERLNALSPDAAAQPGEEILARIFAGEQPDPLSASNPELEALLELVWLDRRCPREGRSMQIRTNPRCPELGQELFCSCGFQTT
jgi:hypothetical protein